MAVLAENAHISLENKLSVIDIFTRINVKSLPATHHRSFLAFILDVSTSDIGEHNLEMVFIDEDAEVIARGTGIIDIELTDEAGSGVQAFIFPLSRVQVKSLGEHRFDVFIDGRFLASVPLTIRLAEEDEEADPLPGSGR